ncbi:MAG: RluA family pseudouridine synthase [Hyphomicrobiales bacterium]|nr:RluA family pseudouridine synthase [Hyphomicrobiales bacterium]
MTGGTSESHEFTAGAADARQRLDKFLAGRLCRLSRSRLQALIRAGHVSRAGATLCEPGTRVNEGDKIRVTIPPPAPAAPLPEDIPLRIVYEDGDLIVIDKQAGLIVHPGAGAPKGTLVNALIAHCGDSLSGVGGVKRPGIVHRLDKDTSGLLVAAKNDTAHRGLARQFASHGRDGGLERAYLALVWGVPARRKGTVSAPLARAPAARTKRAVSERGKEAVTHYKVLRAFGAVAALVECRLETGRTHQIRVHMAHIGHPLMGDRVYGAGFKTRASKLSNEARAALDALGRQALHAALLGFAHPVTGEKLRFEAPPPADMQALIEALGGNERT